MLRNSKTRWGSMTKALHWLVSILIISMLILGWVAELWPRDPTKISLFFWHKSIGILILSLVGVRIIWRLFNPPPAPDPNISATQARLAKFGHLVLYLLIFAMPLSGWLVQSSSNYPFEVFGWFELPDLIADNKAARSTVKAIHLYLSWTLIAVVVGHIAMALKHHFVDRNDTLRRMLPGKD